MAKDWARQLYNSKRWKVVRGIALRRDHFTCQRCGGRAEEVHHVIELTPDNINNTRIALSIDNLECLCHNCHTRETQGSDGDVSKGYIFDEDGHVVERTSK